MADKAGGEDQDWMKGIAILGLTGLAVGVAANAAKQNNSSVSAFGFLSVFVLRYLDITGSTKAAIRRQEATTIDDYEP